MKHEPLVKQLPKVMICHPLRGSSVSCNFYRGMLSLARSYKGEIDFQISTAFSAFWARESLAEKFLKSDFEYLFFIDTDIGLPQGSLEKLLSHDKPMITGMAFNRQYPFSPRIFTALPEEKGYTPILAYPEGLVEIDACGADCLLIKREVFATVPQPWFQHPRIDFTEDIYFCQAVKKAGFRIFADTTVKTLHDSTMTVTEALFKENKPQ